jgi:hypothetical protein
MQCDLLSMGKDTAAYHRFLDDLTKRFPTQKEVLIRNGDCCTDRKTYTKALRNFENAAKIDSVDPRIARGILRARLGIAEEAYKKRQPAKVNWELIESLASSNKSCPEHSLWRLRVRRIVLEVRGGMKEDDLVALATDTLPHSPSAFLLETACRFAIIKSGFSFKEETLAKIFPSRPAPASLADFLTVLDEDTAFEDSSLHATVGVLTQQLFTAHRALLVRFVAVRKDLTTLLIKLFSCSNPKFSLASPVIQDWFAREPNDPLLRFICTSYGFHWLPSPPHHDLGKLAVQLRDSTDPDDRRLLLLFQKDVYRFRGSRYGGNDRSRSPKLDLDYDPHDGDDEYDGCENYGDDEYDDEDFSAIDQTLGKMNPADLIKALENIMANGGQIPGLGNFTDPFARIPSPSKPPRP